MNAEASLFDHRLTLDASYYRKKTYDAFTTINVSPTNGVEQYVMNGGDITNTGYSFSVNGTLIKTRDINWQVSTYYSSNFNKVTSDNATNYKIGD